MFLIKSHPTFEDIVDQIRVFQFELGQEELPFLPDNHVEVLYNMGPVIKRKMIGSIRPLEIASGEMVLCSCRSKGMSLEGTDLSFLCAKIHPQYTRHLFPEGPVERDTMVSLGHFPERMDQAGFEGHLRKWIEGLDAMESSYFLEEAISIIRSSRGEVKVKEVNDMLGVSKSYMEQRFSQDIGLMPKEFCKIEKMKHFIENYKQYQDSMNLTQLTFKSGYYDQSHLIKDFRYFMDSRPRDFIKMHGATF